jgi:thiamine biosynthesis lipoprotein
MPRALPIVSWLVVALVSSVSTNGLAAEDFAFFHENVMGTSLELRVKADDREAARRAEAFVLGEIDRLSMILGGYDASTEFVRWQANAGAPVRVSTELFEVLEACDLWMAKSGGAFDPRVEAFTRLWARGAKLDRRPSDSDLAAARGLLNQRAWRLDPIAQTALRVSPCPVSLNGIAKGYIVERACDRAITLVHGIRGLMLNVGGDLRTRGQIECPIGIADPMADSESSEPLVFIEAVDRSVATSGRSQRGFRIGGQWYSHVIDPRSGQPVSRVLSATVVAAEGAAADALAKVCNVLEPAESLRLLSRIENVECLIVLDGGGVAQSDGWHRLVRPRPGPLAVAHAPKPVAGASSPATGRSAASEAAATPWNGEFELVVNFEISQPEAPTGRYRRPFVAVWVEDPNGAQVRTLTLWVSMGGSGPFQWLPDLKRWYPSEEDRKRLENKDIFFTVARPTRQPGKYSVIWDGKDNHGKALDAGEYTIHVEAAREHGTYQGIRKRVAIADKPFHEDLKGNVEIKSASIEYRRKAQAK